MTDSTNLALPYLEGAQAQKHVTVNESLRKLDALVLLAVEDRDLTAPPGSPADGSRYIPAATASGAWSGKENHVAHYVDGAWEFYPPREGFSVYVRDEDRAYVYGGSAWLRANRAEHVDVSSDTTLTAAHAGRTVRADASGGAVAVTLASSPAGDDYVTVRKTDSSANRVTVKAGATDVAFLSAQGDNVTFAYWGGAWVEIRRSIAPVSEVFTANGTWTKPPLARAVEAICIGAGGGGGSGRRAGSGGNRCGGQGGQGGILNTWRFAAAALGATETVTVGAGGTGGAAQTNNTNDGIAGSAGGTSSFGTHLVAAGGAGGPGGTTASAGTAMAFGVRGAPSQSATATASGATSAVPAASCGAGTGGNGGPINTSNVAFDGAAGGAGSNASNTATAGGAGGAAGANNGSAGASVSDTANQTGGAGGGGGGGNGAGAGGAGGAGGAPGGGGGGGGASPNGNNSGAGGDGARGEVRVITYF